jgi:hypothetical protein
MGRGGLDTRARHLAEPLVVRGAPRARAVARLAPPGRWNTVGHAGAIRHGRAMGAALGEGVRTVGVLHVRQPCGSRAPESQAAAPQLPRGPPRGGRASGLGAHPPAAPHGDRVRVERLVWGRTTREGRHGARRPAPHRESVLDAERRPPVPGEPTRDGEDEIGTRGRPGLEPRLRTGVERAGYEALALPGQETDLQGPGRQRDAAGILVRCGGEAPEVASASVGC